MVVQVRHREKLGRIGLPCVLWSLHCIEDTSQVFPGGRLLRRWNGLVSAAHFLPRMSLANTCARHAGFQTHGPILSHHHGNVSEAFREKVRRRQRRVFFSSGGISLFGPCCGCRRVGVRQSEPLSLSAVNDLVHILPSLHLSWDSVWRYCVSFLFSTYCSQTASSVFGQSKFVAEAVLSLSLLWFRPIWCASC